MKIEYTYTNYPDCPKATEYSKSEEEAAAYIGMFLGAATIGAIIAFVFYTYSFFEEYNWESFLLALGAIFCIGMIDLWFVCVRPNNTKYEIKIILLESKAKEMPLTPIKEFGDILRKEAKEESKKMFRAFFPVFIALLFDTIALIGAINGVYRLCHRRTDLWTPLIAIIAVCILSCFVALSMKHLKKVLSYSEERLNRGDHSSYKEDDNNSIAFCRKCGKRVLPDSIFCSNCGTKVR